MSKLVSALCAAILVSCLSVTSAYGAERSAAEHEPVKTGHVNKTNPDTRPLTSSADEGQLSPWYFFVGLSNAYPKMESEKLVRNYYDGLMHRFSPTFDDVLTVGDVRDMGLLWVPYVGLGRTFGDKWSVFGQLGFSAGKVRTKADDKSYLLLPLHTDFEIQRGAFYAGLGADYFPWGLPELKEYHGIKERLRAARPNIGGRVTCVSATYRAKAKVGWKPFDNLVDMTISDEWVIPSVAPSVGLDVPLGPKSQLSFGASYSWFKEQEDDFNGPAFTIIWKRHFSAKRK